MSKVVLLEERQRQHALKVIADLDLSKKWVVEVKRFVKARSNPQLALYWKWLSIIADDTGNDKEDLHEYLKVKFLAPEEYVIFGEVHLRFSTQGDAKRMGDYMDKVLAFANSQLGIFLPLPEDQHEQGR